MTLTRGLVNGQRVQTRLYSVNGVKRRQKDFVGKFFTVAFRPEDLRLVEGSPSRRREFIDTVLGVVDPEYAIALKTYEDALKRRNKLLQQIRDGLAPASILNYWNTLVLRDGQVLQRKRSEFFQTFGTVPFPVQFQLAYQPSIMSQAHLTEHLTAEISTGHTLIGPHKDDFCVTFLFGGQSRNVAHYGSRGQQRLAVLWLKVCELFYIKKLTRHHPVLLLDDILSELDEAHRQDVLSLLQQGQAIVTTTEEKVLKEIQLLIPSVGVIEL
jgi:DNA replication and repair protein RecF